MYRTHARKVRDGNTYKFHFWTEVANCLPIKVTSGLHVNVQSHNHGYTSFFSQFYEQFYNHWCSSFISMLFIFHLHVTTVVSIMNKKWIKSAWVTQYPLLILVSLYQKVYPWQWLCKNAKEGSNRLELPPKQSLSYRLENTSWKYYFW